MQLRLSYYIVFCVWRTVLAAGAGPAVCTMTLASSRVARRVVQTRTAIHTVDAERAPSTRCTAQHR